MHSLSWLPWFCFMLAVGSASHKASFYGNSYIHLSLQEAKSKTTIDISFLTKCMDALLLLVAGKIDFCLVVLDAGGIKVRINTGSGEKELTSPRSLQLNDLKWHRVNITRENHELAMTVDGIHTTALQLPPRFYELNIDYGVFLGGIGNFRDLFLGHLSYYRGCMKDVTYNGMDVLETSEAISTTSGNVVHAITFDCSVEFQAPENSIIRFLGGGSFLSLASPASSKAAFHLTFEVLTKRENGLIFYTTNSLSEFIALELMEGSLSLLMSLKNNVALLKSRQKVQDGYWHEVLLHCSSGKITITVDRTSTQETSVPKYVTCTLSNDHFWFVGGVEMNLQVSALRQGVKFATMSFEGCLRQVVLNGQRVSFRNALVTHGLSVGCSEACNASGECLFDKQVFTVNEGSSVYMTFDDVSRFGELFERSSFSLVRRPEHGRVEVGSTVQRQDELSFTWQDLIFHHVRYVHDGSESLNDSITIRDGDDKQLEMRFQIVPVNDPPVVVLFEDGRISVPLESEMLITRDLVEARDPDNLPEELVIAEASPYSDHRGHFSRVGDLASPITTFSQSDVNSESIAYVQRDSIVAVVALQATDSHEASAISVLHLMARRWRVGLANNTGLLVSFESSVRITPSNLSAVVDAAEGEQSPPSPSIQVFQPPNQGSLIKETPSGAPEEVAEIEMEDVKQGSIFYSHKGKPTVHEDVFRFRIRVGGVVLLPSYEFRIRFAPSSVEMASLAPVVLQKTDRSLVTRDHLLAHSPQGSVDEEGIRFVILKAPLFGDLWLSENGQARKLGAGDAFGQRHVTERVVEYKLRYPTDSQLSDRLVFTVKLSGWTSGDRYELGFSHLPRDPDNTPPLSVDALEGTMKVVGGGGSVGPRSHDESGAIMCNVTAFPDHGWLHTLQSDFHGGSGRHNVTSFTVEELQNGRLLYEHDDSESPEDAFQFSAVYFRGGVAHLYVKEVRIRVVPRNDNPPYAATDLVLFVVTGGEKVITSDTVRFCDADRDSEPSDIQITREELINGAFFLRHEDEGSITQVEEIFHFTQADVDAGRIFFRHQGDPNGSCALWVTDGEFYVTAVLSIYASDPFIRIVTNTGIIVPYGSSALIHVGNVTVVTNVDAPKDRILFRIHRGPSHGDIRVREQVVQEFSLRDLEEELVTYNHAKSSSRTDEVLLKISVDSTSVDHTLPIRVYPQSYWSPLEVSGVGGSMPILEGTRKMIAPNHLSVIQKNVPKGEISYLVKKYPELGRLEIESQVVDKTSSHGEEKSKVVTFTQATIDEGRLFFIHEKASGYEDSIVFDVTNGILFLSDVTLRVEVVPRIIPLETNAWKVEEGGNFTLDEGSVRVNSSYHWKAIQSFEVLEAPLHGNLVIGPCEANSSVRSFSISQMLRREVTYCHDGSEHNADQLVIRARSSNATSAPVIASVEVKLINDQAPYIVNNTGWTIWESSYLLLKPEILGAYDIDTGPEKLIFHVTGVLGGYFTITSIPSEVIDKFSQQQVNDGKIFFVHSGSERSASFRFYVTDGFFHTDEEVVRFDVRVPHIILKHNRVLRLAPGSHAVITDQHLCAVTDDPNTDSYHIRYIVRKRPSLGELRLSRGGDGDSEVTDTFLQADLNLRHLSYRYSEIAHGSALQLAADAFFFDVESRPSEPLRNVEFRVTISTHVEVLREINENLTFGSLLIEEGGNATVGPAEVNAEDILSLANSWSLSMFGDASPLVIFFKATALPRHGSLLHRGKPMRKPFSLSVDDVTEGQLTYQHDGTETTADEFTLAILSKKWHSSHEEFLLLEDRVFVEVKLINDQPLSLLTPEPRFQVARGRSVRFSRRELLAVDSDTLPGNIVYEVVGQPSEGIVSYTGSAFASPVTRFTQEQVDANEVLYLHGGGSSFGNDTILFRVSDGLFQPETGRMHFTILSSLPSPGREGIPVRVAQGSTKAVLSPENLGYSPAAATGFPLLNFTVTQNPLHGKIEVVGGESQTDSFDLKLLEAGRVRYVQTDMRAHEDSFGVEASGREAARPSETVVRVEVVPLVRSPRDISFDASGDAVMLLPEHIDSSMLARSTGSDPKFRVVKEPASCEVRRLRKEGAHASLGREDEFTGMDVSQGLIFLVPRDRDASREVLDFLEYEVDADNVQPARGLLEFTWSPARSGFLQKDAAGDLAHPAEDAKVVPKAVRDFQLQPSPILNTFFVTGTAAAVVVGLVTLSIVMARCFLKGRARRGMETFPPTNRKDSPELQVCPDGDCVDFERKSPVSSPTSVSRTSCRVSTIDDITRRSRSPFCTSVTPVFGSSPVDCPQVDPEDDENSSSGHCHSCQSNPLLRKNQYWV